MTCNLTDLTWTQISPVEWETPLFLFFSKWSFCPSKANIANVVIWLSWLWAHFLTCFSHIQTQSNPYLFSATARFLSLPRVLMSLEFKWSHFHLNDLWLKTFCILFDFHYFDIWLKCSEIPFLRNGLLPFSPSDVWKGHKNRNEAWLT